MYDAGKIITGIIIFLVLMTSPFWLNIASGKGSYKPEIKIATEEKQCVADTDYMKAAHMDLIYEWRDQVVRNEKRIYTSSNGKTYNMSLTKTCMNCHSNKSEFCDRCHSYVGVTPYCWDCHVEPKEVVQ
jgi:hypothetical protein